MSRSRRKTPILAHTNSGSESKDKAIWHRRWRRGERTNLAGASQDKLDEHLSLDKKKVSSPWDMSKDGKGWMSQRNLENSAEFSVWRVARGRKLSERETARLKLRGLRKLMGK